MQAGENQPRLRKYAWIFAGLSLLSTALVTAMAAVSRFSTPMLILLAVLWFVTLLIVVAIAYLQRLSKPSKPANQPAASQVEPPQVVKVEVVEEKEEEEGGEEEGESMPQIIEEEREELVKSLLADLQEMSRYDKIVDYLLIFTLAGFAIYGIGYLKGSSMLENAGIVAFAAPILLMIGVSIYYLFKDIYKETRERILPLPARAVVYFLSFFALSYGAVALVALAMGTASYVPNIPQSTYLLHITKLIVLNPMLAEASLALSAVATAAMLWREVHRG